MMLPLNAITVDTTLQARLALSDSTIAEYADLMRDGVMFPPISAIRDGDTLLLVDGFHRYAAASAVGVAEIAVTVADGSRRDAQLAAISANTTHGLRRTRADVQRAIGLVLDDAEWAQWSVREIARRVGCDHKTVAAARRARAEAFANFPTVGKLDLAPTGGEIPQPVPVAAHVPWIDREAEAFRAKLGEFMWTHPLTEGLRAEKGAEIMRVRDRARARTERLNVLATELADAVDRLLEGDRWHVLGCKTPAHVAFSISTLERLWAGVDASLLLALWPDLLRDAFDRQRTESDALFLVRRAGGVPIPPDTDFDTGRGISILALAIGTSKPLDVPPDAPAELHAAHVAASDLSFQLCDLMHDAIRHDPAAWDVLSYPCAAGWIVNELPALFALYRRMAALIDPHWAAYEAEMTMWEAQRAADVETALAEPVQKEAA